MRQNIHIIYHDTLEKYRKFKSRYVSGVKTGRFYQYSSKRQNQIVDRLEQLSKRIKYLKQQVKVAIAAGAITLCLSAGTASGQELGPFVQNDLANPIPNPPEVGLRSQVTSIDIDNDGDFDFVVGTNYNGIEFIENVGTASEPKLFKRIGAQNPFNGIIANDNASPTFGDFDGDGDLDLLYGSNYERLDLHLNTGTASNPVFNNTAESPSSFDVIENGFPGTGPFYTRPRAVDIDDDGDLDILLGRNFYSNDYSGVALWTNDGSNNFTEQSVSNNPFFNPIYNINQDPLTRIYRAYPSFVDIDNDGDLDAFIGEENGTFRFFENTGTVSNAVFSDEITGAGNPLEGFDVGANAAPHFVDIDDDGDFDLVSGQLSQGALEFFENTGTASSPVFEQRFGSANPFDGFTANYNLAPAIVDLNGDGDLDIVIGEKYTNELSYFENDLNGEFTQIGGSSNPLVGIPPTSGNYVDPSFADIDNDGDPDLFIGREGFPGGPSLGQVIFYRNNAGTFVSETNPIDLTSLGISQNYVNFGFTLGKFDTDGDFDAVLTNHTYNYGFEFLRNDGTDSSPNFVVAENSTSFGGFATSSSYFYPQAVDLDHDGDDDLVAGGGFGSYNGQLFFFLNDGTGLSLQTDSNSPFFNSFSGVNFDFGSQAHPAFIDSDGDGDLDVLLGLSGGNLTFLENQNIPAGIATTVNNPITYNEGDNPLQLNNTLVVFDQTDDPIIEARVIIENYVSGEDFLDFDNSFGTSGSFETTGPNAGSLIISVPQTTSYTDIATVLRGVTYENIGANPTGGTRNIRFEVIDFDYTDPGPGDIVTVAVDVISNNVAPVLTTSSGNTIFTGGQGAVPIDPNLTVSDGNDTDLEGASVIIVQNYLETEDNLEFTDQNGITGSFEAGTLTLSGTSSVANYQAALRSVTYNNSSSEPNSESRSILFRVNDGEADSPDQIKTVDVITGDSQPPQVNTTPATTQIGSTIIIDLCNIISDPDNTYEELTIEVVSILSEAPTVIDGCDLSINYQGINFEGEDNIVIRATDPDGNFDENTLTITVESEPPPSGQIEIFNAVSPNGDGLNDFWEILNLQSPNTIQLYNRWGDEVKSLNNVEIDGNNRAEIDLSDLPAATYFYKINTPQGSFEGFIVLKK